MSNVALDYLRAQEWSMGTGQCPACYGMGPMVASFYPSKPDAHGHREDCPMSAAISALSHAAGQDGEQCRAASGEAGELALTLERMADNAYCDYIRKMQRDECLGWEEKVRRGSFDSDNLRAHVGAGELLGRHRALHEAAKLLRALSRGVPEGQDDVISDAGVIFRHSTDSRVMVGLVTELRRSGEKYEIAVFENGGGGVREVEVAEIARALRAIGQYAAIAAQRKEG
jgi:hypothetical protein